MKYKNLFTPIKINQTIIKNRIVAAPIGDVFEEKAIGGAGIVVAGHAIVEYGRSSFASPTEPDVFSKYEVEKTYNVTLKGQITDEEVEKLKNGVQIEDYITGKAKVKILRIDKEKSLSRVEIIIHEGKNREVRKMCEAIGRKVLALHRTKIGNISVKDLRLGTWRYLKPNEIKSLLDI